MSCVAARSFLIREANVFNWLHFRFCRELSRDATIFGNSNQLLFHRSQQCTSDCFKTLNVNFVTAGGQTPNLNDLLSDPELLAAFQVGL